MESSIEGLELWLENFFFGKRVPLPILSVLSIPSVVGKFWGILRLGLARAVTTSSVSDLQKKKRQSRGLRKIVLYVCVLGA